MKDTTDPGAGPLGAPMSARAARLRPVTPDDYRYLYELSLSTEISYRWRLRGTTPSFETFVTGLYAGVLVQFIVCNRAGERFGLLSAYNADMRNGFVYLAYVLEPRRTVSTLSWSALVLFVNYLFTGWQFRKVYAETSALSIETFSSGAKRYYAVEGVLTDHEYYDGRYWDTFILAFHRSQWEGHLDRLLPLIGAQ